MGDPLNYSRNKRGCGWLFGSRPWLSIVAALLFHQVNRLWEYGFAGTGQHYAPVFGVRLPRRTAAAGQLAALPAALLVALTIPSLVGRTAVVLLVVFWMLATQVRLSDHCWLGAVAVAVMAFTPSPLHALVAEDLLAGVYLTAALLKVNDEIRSPSAAPAVSSRATTCACSDCRTSPGW